MGVLYTADVPASVHKFSSQPGLGPDYSADTYPER